MQVSMHQVLTACAAEDQQRHTFPALCISCARIHLVSAAEHPRRGLAEHSEGGPVQKIMELSVQEQRVQA